MNNAFSGTAVAPLVDAKQKTYLMLDESAGVQWLDAQAKSLASLAQPAELFDWRSGVTVAQAADKNKKGEQKSLLVAATVFLPEQQPGLVTLDTATGELRELLRLPIPSFKIENLCLNRDSANNLSVYLLDERGTAEHWLLLDTQGNQHIKHLRNLPISPNSKACAVDDAQDLLFISEESIGVWAYGASVETAPGRSVVDMAAPYGKLMSGAEAIAVVPQGLLAVVPEDKTLLVYSTANHEFKLQQQISLNNIEEAESISANYNPAAKMLDVVIYDEGAGVHQQLQLPWSVAPQAKPVYPIASVTADVQTQVMARFGDAADDPAIWINKKRPQKSLVIGTNKQQGLFVYDLQGKEVQHFNTGKLNNVDVRYGVQFGKKVVDIAVATNRDDNSLAIYTIDPKNGKLSFSGSVATNLEEIYGFCMYQNATGVTYAIPNAKSGEFQQIELTAVAHPSNKNQWQWQGKKVRSFFVKSQPEGCVADDKNQRLFVGEEDEALWTIGAEPDSGTQVELVLRAGDVLVADVEGVGIYQGKQKNYLVVSSQGNNTYVILDAVAPYQVRGIIRVDLDAENGIDGVSETDGLEVTHVNMGKQFPEGMLVVQDGHNVMPEAPQNFKYVSWEKIRTALKLD
ncbi:phytase [Cellvibrio sp. NN19]|uniref:phytase n=1 Tax=Cellvibrio chitinivorans TaxID=3102792 RepID=UPI002B415452|nr:phytase [Cellvibrio sp. NN19]